MQFPAYDNSLLSLSSSILSYYGAEAVHHTLPQLDAMLKQHYRHVVVMLFDGMGSAVLKKHLPPDAFLRRHWICDISSVFPPTTTAATVSMESGLSPIEHGWLGWSLYFPEIGDNVNIFPNTISGTCGIPAADYPVAGRYLHYEDIFSKIKAAGEQVEAVHVSPFSAYHSQSVEEICQTVKSLCAEEGQRFIYAYWHQPDYDIHDYGTAHPQIRADIEYINGEVEGLCHGVSDTLVIVTADHGLVDTTWVYLEDYPDVMECLAQKPSIESRALSFFIKPGMNDVFEDVFRKHFGEIYRLLPKEQVLRENWFGAGTPHPHVKAFIGDYLAVAFSHTSIETGSRNQANTFKGAHAGCTAEEMNIPFIAVSCGK